MTRATNSWSCTYYVHREGPVHVWPQDDLIDHDLDDEGDCACGVTTQPVERADGSFGWVYVHHPLDGRPEG